jgi:hypothetical protein
MLFSSAAFSQEIKNVIASAGADDKVTIQYDFIDASKGKHSMEVFLSRDGGSSFDQRLSAVSGDVKNVISGTAKKIIWDAGKELSSYSGTAQFKVVAYSEMYPWPKPYEDESFKMEVVSCRGVGTLITLEVLITMIKKSERFILSKENTYINDETHTQFRVKKGNIGSTDLNDYVIYTKGVPVKALLTFDGPGETAMLIPYAVMRFQYEGFHLTLKNIPVSR